MTSTALWTRPFSCHKAKVKSYQPTIKGKVYRVSRSKRNAWRAEAIVNDAVMWRGHFDTKAAAGSKCERMVEAYTNVHYESK